MSILDEQLLSFHESIDKHMQIFGDTMDLYTNERMFNKDMRDMLINYTFLDMYSLWERFLENIFIQYMLGDKSDNGDNVIRYVTPSDRDHAYNLIKNTNSYPDWGDIGKVILNAENFFKNGGSFKILKTTKGELTKIKKIRNAIAHVSSRAYLDFENLVRGNLGYLPSDINTATFLSEHKTGTGSNKLTFIEHFFYYLKNEATLLVEYHNE